MSETKGEDGERYEQSESGEPTITHSVRSRSLRVLDLSFATPAYRKCLKRTIAEGTDLEECIRCFVVGVWRHGIEGC